MPFLAPINGMYGIKDAEGYVNVYNEGALYGAIDVAMFILMIGGFLGITMKTGAIDAGIAYIVKRLGGNGKMLIPILMIIFAAGGTSYGMAEESLAFYPLIIAAMIALGYDAVTGVAVVMLGAGIGVIGSTINPFATGIATGFAGIPLAEGIFYRILILVGGLAIGIWWVMRYAARVQKDPSKSMVADMKQANEEHFLRSGGQSEAPEFTTRRKVVLGLFVLVVRDHDRRRDSMVGPRHQPHRHTLLVVRRTLGAVPGDGPHHRRGVAHERVGFGEQLHRRRARHGGGGAGGGAGARHLRAHDERPDHRHGAALV